MIRYFVAHECTQIVSPLFKSRGVLQGCHLTKKAVIRECNERYCSVRAFTMTPIEEEFKAMSAECFLLGNKT